MGKIITELILLTIFEFQTVTNEAAVELACNVIWMAVFLFIKNLNCSLLTQK